MAVKLTSVRSKADQKIINFWMLLGLEAFLLIFTGIHAINLIMLTLPPNMAWAGYIALGALGGGVVFWTKTFINGSDGLTQHVIAASLIVICFIGEVAAFVTDMFIQAGKNGISHAVDTDTTSFVVGVICFVIVSNLAAIIAHVLFDPKRRRAKAEAAIRAELEETEAAAELDIERTNLDIQIKLQKAALIDLQQQAPAIIAAAIPNMVENQVNYMVARNRNSWGTSRLALQSTAPASIIEQPAQEANHLPPPTLPEWANQFHMEPTHQPVSVTRNVTPPAKKVYDLDSLLAESGLDRRKAKALLAEYGINTPGNAYEGLKRLGKMPAGITFREFEPLFAQLIAPATKRTLQAVGPVGGGSADGGGDDIVINAGRGTRIVESEDDEPGPNFQ